MTFLKYPHVFCQCFTPHSQISCLLFSSVGDGCMYPGHLFPNTVAKDGNIPFPNCSIIINLRTDHLFFFFFYDLPLEFQSCQLTQYVFGRYFCLPSITGLMAFLNLEYFLGISLTFVILPFIKNITLQPPLLSVSRTFLSRFSSWINFELYLPGREWSACMYFLASTNGDTWCLLPRSDHLVKVFGGWSVFSGADK